MYRDYYQFREPPFNVTSDPGFFYLSSRHSDALSHLTYGIEERKGISVITGEIGTGKTTLCRAFLNQLKSSIKSALILNPYFSETQLLQLIISDLNIKAKGRTKLNLINALNEYLLEQTSQGNNVIVMIDEAQNLNVRQLEQIRLLSNLETEKTKLLQIILIGQPELSEKLRLNSLRQLNQRISIRFHILPLDEPEIGEYIKHRMKIASGAANGDLPAVFSPEALGAVYFYSKGIPRLINILCDRALLAGYVQETKTINEHMVYKCAKEIGQ